ncbi:hypothetical protein C8J57DRAFT_1515176 [Mycena rebaudengoi]|nr:hypothetical protein C8J57DRAFT_1515176 [Mycena rebaudengoi]
MPHWYHKILIQLFKERDIHEATTVRYKNISRPKGDVPVIEVAKYIQYSNLFIRGCPWQDLGFSLDLTLVRGSQLCHATGIELDKADKDDVDKRQRQAKLHGIMIEALATPSGYKDACSRLHLNITPVRNLRQWPDANINEVTTDDIYRRFADMGLPLAAVDDAYHFALQWISDCVDHPIAEWPSDRINTVLARAKTEKLPERLAPPNVSLYLRPITLPWKSTADLDAQFRAVWRPRANIPYVWGWKHSKDYYDYQRSLNGESSDKKSLASRIAMMPESGPSSASITSSTTLEPTSMDVDNKGPLIQDDEEVDYDDEYTSLDPILPASPFEDSLLPEESSTRM